MQAALNQPVRAGTSCSTAQAILRRPLLRPTPLGAARIPLHDAATSELTVEYPSAALMQPPRVRAPSWSSP
eukprot:CAMPEP_0202923878 /NCGR_PEP_ID=MMETSP1392-20130828/78678_1 /ASSEMBLY_ACC=CAM_ASM_000868 /TAXON_ID=225041 /ORGANISM="Chlamydomonas chlamydogama, Strain SAG 11-48b" /LENGTH=70 /DNA_ID=CAMNT_0049617577 /DNA_START=566 /DNA_END=774 /DNA_ORIENTATION=-